MLTLSRLIIPKRPTIVPRGPISAGVFCRFFTQITRADGRIERPILWHDDPALPPLVFPHDEFPDATLIVNTGRAVLTALLAGGIAYPKFVGWGTGAGTTGQTDTAVFTEDSGGSPVYARISGTQTQVTGVTGNDTYQLIATISANAGKSITNMGVFDALTLGNLFIKSDFASQGLNASDSITFTIQVRYQ